MARTILTRGPFSRPWRKRVTFGLPTILGLRRRGWFIPHRHADQIEAPARYAALEPLFDAAKPAFRKWLEGMAPHVQAFEAIAEDRTEGRARWNQGWFPRLDAASLYTAVRRRRPRRAVEVGSGHSTRFLLRALADAAAEGEAIDCAVTAIDPAPRASLANAPGLRLVRRTLQSAGLEPFETLAPGDMLLIDSSHVLMPGSDVDILFAEVLPRLPPGVLVQVHDVFLPDGYPADWSWRGYNEQQGLVGWLAAGRLALRFSSHYAATRMRKAVAKSAVGAIGLEPGARETALWLETQAIHGAPSAITPF